jgi:excisionase family DNA binding protein
MTATSIPALVGVDELADHLGTSPRHVRRPIAERRVPYLKVGGYVRFDPHEIAA